MTRYTITTTDGRDEGTYEAETADDAIDAHLDFLGYVPSDEEWDELAAGLVATETD